MYTEATSQEKVLLSNRTLNKAGGAEQTKETIPQMCFKGAHGMAVLLCLKKRDRKHEVFVLAASWDCLTYLLGLFLQPRS